MTLPVDLVLDLHQDGLRLHVNTYKLHPDELCLTGPYGESIRVPFRQVALLADWLALAARAVAQWQQGARPVTVRE